MSPKCQPDIREKPEILCEEDLPFPSKDSLLDEDSHAREIRLKEEDQRHNHGVENYKNKVGGIVLAACFAVIVGFAIADAVFGVESSLFSGAFEFSKTIATAVIGYLFATNMKGK